MYAVPIVGPDRRRAHLHVAQAGPCRRATDGGDGRRMRGGGFCDRTGVEAVDPRTAAALQDRIAASPELLDVLAPLVGMLMRERQAA